MKKTVALIIAGTTLVGAIAFTQIPYLKAKADTADSGNYGIMSPNLNYKAMYDYMKNINAKDMQNMMSGRISESQAQNMLNDCTSILKSADQQ